MSDFHATERIIGGFVVAGVASLLSWSHAQNGEPGVLGTLLLGVIVLGGLWAAFGLFELFAGPRPPESTAGTRASDRTGP